MDTDIVIRQPNPEPHEKGGSLLVSQANEVTVTNNDEREHAGMFKAQIDATIKAIEMEFDGTDDNPGPVALAHKTWKSGVALRDRALKFFEEAKGIIDRKIKKFEYDTEQARLAEARRLEQEAIQEAELKRKQELLEAKRLGDKEALKSLKEAPLQVKAAAPSIQEVGKVAGMRRSSPDWDFTITDANKIPKKFWVVDEKKLRAQVKSLGMEHGIPGISVFDRRSVGN